MRLRNLLKFKMINESQGKEELLFKQQEKEFNIILNNEQLNYLVQLCKYEINSNEDLINDLKGKKEKEIWKEEIDFTKKLIKRIESLRAEQEHSQFVIQALNLTSEQEDYLLESGLEQMREARENGL